MNIKFISTVPNLTIGSLTWSSVGASLTVDTDTLKAYERANIEKAYSIGNLIADPLLLNNSISATEDNISPTALGGDVRASVVNGNVVLRAPGISSIQTGGGAGSSLVTNAQYDGSGRLTSYTLSGQNYTVTYPDAVTIIVTGGGQVVTTTVNASGNIVNQTSVSA